MFLHIGGSQIVFDYELVGIFNYELAGGMETVATNSLKAKHNALHFNNDQPKSLVLTDKDLYLSPIAPLTLARRFKNIAKK